MVGGDEISAIVFAIGAGFMLAAGWNLAGKNWLDGIVYALIGLIVLFALWLFEKVTEPSADYGRSYRMPDNLIQSDAPYHPEYAVQRAAELVEQRGGSGRNRGQTKHLFCADHSKDGTAQSGNHAHQAYLDWMQEVVPGHSQSRAAEAGVVIHIVSEHMQDHGMMEQYQEMDKYEREHGTENGGYWR